jgi:hypothetical protein
MILKDYGGIEPSGAAGDTEVERPRTRHRARVLCLRSLATNNGGWSPKAIWFFEAGSWNVIRLRFRDTSPTKPVFDSFDSLSAFPDASIFVTLNDTSHGPEMATDHHVVLAINRAVLLQRDRIAHTECT